MLNNTVPIVWFCLVVFLGGGVTVLVPPPPPGHPIDLHKTL